MVFPDDKVILSIGGTFGELLTASPLEYRI